MKRIVSLLLCLLMVVSLFVGCGSQEATSAPAETSTVVSEAAPETAEEPAPEEAPVEESVVEEPTEPEAPAHVLPLTEEDITFSLFTGMNPNLMTYIDTYAETAIIRWLTETTGVKVDIPAVFLGTQNYLPAYNVYYFI